MAEIKCPTAGKFSIYRTKVPNDAVVFRKMINKCYSTAWFSIKWNKVLINDVVFHTARIIISLRCSFLHSGFECQTTLELFIYRNKIIKIR